MAARVHTGCAACQYSTRPATRPDGQRSYLTDNQPRYEANVYSLNQPAGINTSPQPPPSSNWGYLGGRNEMSTPHPTPVSTLKPRPPSYTYVREDTDTKQAVLQEESGYRGSSRLTALGAMLVLFGLVILIVDIAGLVVNDWMFSWTGITLGLWIIVGGIVCMVAGTSKDTVLLIVTMVFAISICGDIWWPIAEYVSTIFWEADIPDADRTVIGLYIAMLVFALLAFVFAIVAAVVAGKLLRLKLVGLLQGGRL